MTPLFPEQFNIPNIRRLEVLAPTRISNPMNAQCVAALIDTEIASIGVEPIIGYDSNDVMCRGLSIYTFEPGFEHPKAWIEENLKLRGVRMHAWEWSTATPDRLMRAIMQFEARNERPDQNSILITLSQAALLIQTTG